MITLVFFLEERSAKALLEGLLPRFLPMERILPRYIVFEGKQDLEKQLVRKIRGWRTPNTRFIVLRDQDSNVCRSVKQHLTELCQQACQPSALVRVACHEIESWYLGDLTAVEGALELRRIARRQRSRKFRDPDQLARPSQHLHELTGGRYQKIGGSRAIGPLLRLDGENRSTSFSHFIDGVIRVANAAMAGG